jgi:hypothetical protein
MAEAAKQFFVGFIHPRTWLAAVLGIVGAVLAALALGGATTGFLASILQQWSSGQIPSSYIKGTAIGILFAMLNVWTGLLMGDITAFIVLIAGGFVAGFTFALLSKKERVASKSIIGGLNEAVIYTLVVLVVYVFWNGSFTYSLAGLGSLAQQAWVQLTSDLLVSILVSFLVIFWISAMTSILILSLKSY